jgi:ubiquinone/menaquinone biosynthesis C-methylase UbiE
VSFDHLAPHYGWMEALAAGPLLQRARTWWLPALAGRREVLSAGEGHGKFAAAFATACPTAALTCVEASAGMAARGRRREGRAGGRARWVAATLPQWRPRPASFDAIVTCFFLDCFPRDQLPAVVAALAEGAREDAVWLVVDFAIPDRGAARWRARAIHAAMYAFFRAVTALPARRLTPPDPWLAAHGFRLEARREFSCGLLRADLWRRGPGGSGTASARTLEPYFSGG